MWDIINFILILILLIIIIAVLLTVIYFYYSIRKYIDDTINHIGSSLPIFNSYEYTSINYDVIEDVINDDLYNSKSFNKNLAKLTCSVNMSSYNIYSEFDPQLSSKIKHIETIGNNCFIYKIRKNKIIIISYRGTRSSDDVITDLDSVQSEMSGYHNSILVHRGFYRLWSPQKDEIRKFAKNYFKEDTIVIVTGHSLGCASALFTSLLISDLNILQNNNIKLYMFAPPRIGNHHLIKKLDNTVVNNYALINISDIVPNLPTVTFPTLGNTWFYDNFTNRYLLDIQMGSIPLNHRLDTYMCSLNNEENSDLQSHATKSDNECDNSIWKKLPILLTQ